MLNAFRHHRGGHTVAADAGSRVHRCAQRLSASQRWASGTRRRARRRVGSCSTPFGITEVGIDDIVERPSAIDRCSTPFGITEVGIRSRTIRRTPCAVLNAFRHHRGGHAIVLAEPVGACSECSTPFGITEVGIRRSPSSSADVESGAQRLSASQRWASRRRRSRPHGQPMVLNAFRHHRGGHTLIGASSAMLDAMCSTPFGITEVGIAPASRHRADVRRVLNAFRHHRGGHAADAVPASSRIAECSTPFGITEVGIAQAGDPVSRRDACSTPFGITEVGIRDRRTHGVISVSVLNAFRHHRGGHHRRQLHDR